MPSAPWLVAFRRRLRCSTGRVAALCVRAFQCDVQYIHILPAKANHSVNCRATVPGALGRPIVGGTRSASVTYVCPPRHGAIATATRSRHHDWPPGVFKKMPHAFEGAGHYGKHLTEYALEHGNLSDATLARTLRRRSNVSAKTLGILGVRG